MLRAAALLLALSALSLPVAANAQQIASARYDDPTHRYGHNVLGADSEWGALTLIFSNGTSRRFVLPDSLVFEDTAPRLHDLDGDGTPEVIVVESSLTQGSRLAVYGPEGRIAATPHIGTKHRWLAPVGAADLDGDGYVEIAYVDRPHLDRILRVWRFRDRGLHHVADRPMLTNHKIGWNFIPGGIRTCEGIPEMIVAMHNWMRVLAVRYRDGTFSSYAVSTLREVRDFDAALTCP